MSLFQPSFSLLLCTRTFSQHPLLKKCTLFSRQSLIRESFSRFLFRHNFPPFLNECQLFISKDFWNLPVNPVWRVPGFMKEGKADNEHSNPVLLPLPPNSQHLHFSFTVASLSKIFVRSRRDWEKKCRIGIRQAILHYLALKIANVNCSVLS